MVEKKKSESKKKRKAIVIGSGFGGLAIAIRLQARGFDVEIFEKQQMPGGHAQQLKKDGYTFDLGPSLITEPQIIQDVFNAAGKDMNDYLELTKLEPGYRIYFHDKTYLDYSGDPDKMKQEIAKFSQKDAANYDKFMQYARKLYQAVIVDKLGSTPFVKWKAFFGFIPRAIALKAILPAYNVVASFFSNPKIRFTFSFHPLFIGGNPFRTPALFLMIPYLERKEGVWFSKGGMYALVQGFVKLFTEIGGRIHVNSEVEEIVVKDGNATGVKVSGHVYEADLVVSNAHSAHTYKDLIPAKARKKWSNKSVLAKKYTMSSFLIYMGVKKQYPELLHHTLILSERYKELITDIFDKKVLADDFSMYLHVPSRTDSSMAPDGKESMYVLVPVPNLAADIDWEEMSPVYTQKILDFLEHEFGMKDLQENIEVLETFNPLDFERQRNNHLGACWSLEPNLFQIANFRAHNRSEDVGNLYLTGASTHPGGGVPGVLLTAETTEKLIAQDFPE